MSDGSEPQPVVALVRDLMFSSKITATARAAGAIVRVVRDPATVVDTPGRLLIVDLNLEGAIKAAAAWMLRHDRPTVGFVSHVDTQTIAAARAAGINQVLARSAFVGHLESLMKSG